ncbi:MAG: hypothetical protein MHMPM18_004723 [Marteilia pararefringens]
MSKGDKMACTRHKYMKSLFRHPQVINMRYKVRKFRDELYPKHQDIKRRHWFWKLPIEDWTLTHHRNNAPGAQSIDSYLMKTTIHNISRQNFIQDLSIA